MKRMMQGWTDPHLSSANMSLCITLFPDPNVSKPGLRREHSLTLPLGDRGARDSFCETKEQYAHNGYKTQIHSSADICRLPCPLREASFCVQPGTLCDISPFRESGVPNFLSGGVHSLLVIFLKTLGLIFRRRSWLWGRLGLDFLPSLAEVDFLP